MTTAPAARTPAAHAEQADLVPWWRCRDVERIEMFHWAADLEHLGVPADSASTVAGWLDRTMGESMLALYRSAIDVAREWSAAADTIHTPGLASIATADPWGNEDLARRVAERAGARAVELDGAGRWWMLQDPRRGARTLEEFWSSVGG